MFRLLEWETGLNIGECDSLKEAKEHVRDEELDVLIYNTKTGESRRYNETVAASEQREAEYEVDQMLLGYYHDNEGEK